MEISSYFCKIGLFNHFRLAEMNQYWKLHKKLNSSRKNEGSANSIRLSVQEIPQDDLFRTSYIIFIILVHLCNLIMSLSRHHFKCPKISFWFCVFHELFFTSKSKFTCVTSRAMKYCHEKISISAIFTSSMSHYLTTPTF